MTIEMHHRLVKRIYCLVERKESGCLMAVLLFSKKLCFNPSFIEFIKINPTQTSTGSLAFAKRSVFFQVKYASVVWTTDKTIKTNIKMKTLQCKRHLIQIFHIGIQSAAFNFHLSGAITVNMLYSPLTFGKGHRRGVFLTQFWKAGSDPHFFIACFSRMGIPLTCLSKNQTKSGESALRY